MTFNFDKVDFGSIGGDEKDDRETLVKSNISEALKVNPEQYAEEKRVSEQTSMPAEAVNDEVKQQFKLDSIDFTKVQDSPKTSRFFSSFDNAVVAQEDFEGMTSLEKSFSLFGQAAAKPGMLLQQFLEGTVRSTEGLGESILLGFEKQWQGTLLSGWDTKATTIDDLVDDDPEMDYDQRQQQIENMKQTLGVKNDEEFRELKRTRIANSIEEIIAIQKKQAELTPEGLNVFQEGLRSGIQSLANQAPGMALSLATANPYPMLTSMTLQTYVDSYADARASGLGESDAGNKAAIDAALEFATERLPTKYLEKILKVSDKGGFKDAAKKFVASEMTGEQIATLTQTMNDVAYGLDEELANAATLEEKLAIQARRQVVTAVSTVVAGGSQLAGATGIRKGIDAYQVHQQKKQLTNAVEQEQIDQINAYSESLKIRERDKETFKQFVNEIDDGKGTKIFIDSAQASLYLNEKTQEEINADPVLKMLQDKVQEAADIGTDVSIPVADFAAEFAGTEHFNNLRHTMTMGEDSVSPINQAQAQKETEDYVKRLMDQADENVSEFVQAQEITDFFYNQLVDTGVYNPKAARTMADMIPLYMNAKAKREGKTIEQVFNEAGLTIEGPQTGEAARLEREADLILEQPSYKDAPEIFDRVRDEFLNIVPEDATVEEVIEVISEFSPEYQNVIKALERHEWLGFDYPSQAINAAFSEELTDFEVSTDLKRAIGRLVNVPQRATLETEQARGAKYDGEISGRGFQYFGQEPGRRTGDQALIEEAKNRTYEQTLAELDKIRRGEEAVIVHRSWDPVDKLDNAKFDNINPKRTPSAYLGHYSGIVDIGNAERHGQVVSYHKIKMNKVFEMSETAFEEAGAKHSHERFAEIRQTLMAQGYDGIIITGVNWTVVFDSANMQELQEDFGPIEDWFLQEPIAEQDKGLQEMDEYGDIPEPTPQQIKQESKQAAKIGSIEYIEKNHPEHYQAIQNQLGKLEEGERARVEKSLNELQGTLWAMQAYRSAALREILDRASIGESIDDIASGTFWSAGGKVNWNDTKLVKAFKLGEEGIATFAQSYNFFGANRKAETDFSGSFLNCEPSKACASFCYSAAGTGGAPSGLMKAEFTEYMANNYPDILADRLSTYKGTPAGLSGLALRLNEKGDLSESQLKLIEELNKRDIRLQIFSKRPELLRKVSDFNWRSLSVDSTNMQVALDNPDLRLAVTVTDNMPAEFMSQVKDRLNVVLPVNLKGVEWTPGEIKSMFPDAKKEVARALCPVDGGKRITTPGTSFVSVVNGLKKKGNKNNAWTCTACDKLGVAGCFIGENQSETVRKTQVHVQFVNSTPKQKAKAIDETRASIKKQLEALVSVGGIDSEQLQNLLKEYDSATSGSTEQFEQAATAGSEAEHNSRSVRDAESGTGFRQDDTGGRVVEPKEARGYFDPANSVIRLTEAADLSTFLHEFAHFMYEMEVNGDTELLQSINNWYKRNATDVAAEANEYYQRDVGDKLEQPLAEQPEGTGKGGPITETDVIAFLDNKTTGDQNKDKAIRRSVHEQFARGFETYVMEGKAPSLELRNAFRTFARWMVAVYKRVTGGLRKPKLDDQMRKVFDRLLATEEQIAAAEARAHFEPMFTDAAMAGMTEEEFAAYQKRQERVKDVETETLRDKVIKQLMRQTQKWWKEEKQDVIDEQTEILKKERVHIARDKLKNTELKLDHATVKEMYGAERTDKLGRTAVVIPAKLSGMTAKGQKGVHPDEAAAFLGYSSGSEMIQDLTNAPSLREAAEQSAQNIMVERHGDIMNDGTIQKEADEAVRNEERGKLILQELKTLAKGTAVPTIDRATIKQIAADRIGKLSFRDIHPGKYRKAELRAAQEAAVALNEGNKQLAADAKMRQVMNYYLAMEATEAKNNTMKIVDRMQRYNKKKVREAIMRAENGYWEQLERILSRFEFKKTATLKEVESLNLWVKERIENDGDGLVISNAVLNESYVTHWKNVPYSDLQGISDSVKNIEHVARYANKMHMMQEELDFQKLKQQWVDHINENEQRFANKSTRSRMDDARKATVSEHLRSWASQLTKIPFLASWLDGGERAGMSHDILMQPFTDALDKKMKLMDEIFTPVLELIDARSKDDKARYNKKIWIPEINDNLTGSQVLSVALNVGNQGNLKKLLLGEGWADPMDDTTITLENPKLQAVLQHMTKEDWEMVQAIWNQMDKLYPQLAEVHRRTTGLTPPKVEATPIQTRFGTFEGGYYPMKYSPERSHKAEKNAERRQAETESMFNNTASIQASVNAGATNERTQFYDRVHLSLDVIPEHFNEVIHYITHHDAVRQVNRLIQSPEVANAITAVLGEAEYKQLKPWLNDIAKDGRGQPTKTYIDAIFQRLRLGTTLGVMGFKASTGIMQLFGIFTTAAEVGVGPTVKAIYKTVGRSWYMKSIRKTFGSVDDIQSSWDFAAERSKVMNHRAKTMDREMRSAMDRISGKHGVLPAVQEASMKHIALIQTYMVDLPTWHAAYMKEISESGDEAKAVKYADWAVENLQGSGATKDMATILRNQSKLLTTMTMFMTFFSSLGNLGRDLVKGRRTGQYSATSTAAKVMFLFILPVFFEMLMRGDFDEPEDEDERMEKFMTQVALYPVTTVPFIRDVASGLISDYGYNSSPVASAIEKGVMGYKQIGERLLTDEEITKAAAKNATKLTGVALAVPGVSQAWATGEHLYDVVEEGEELTFRELLFGPDRK